MLNLLASDAPSLPSWQETLSTLVTDPLELCRLLDLSPESLDLSRQALEDFPLRVPRPYLARMEKGNPRDPLLLQVLPRMAELIELEGYSDDPLQESGHNPVPGVLEKYAGRVLLLPTATCAIHCRYCFRRQFPYESQVAGKAQLENAMDYIRQDDSITEVILSGGDPLTMSDRHLIWLLERLESIPHLERLRLHSRVPIMIPSRTDSPFFARMARSRLQSVIVLHSNHARELDEAVAEACADLKQQGITLLNQSVLLKDINDDAFTLQQLSLRLFRIGVLPYYLHVPDHTRGTAHFGISDEQALDLHSSLQNSLPGYLVPKLVREIPGEKAKTLLRNL